MQVGTAVPWVSGMLVLLKSSKLPWHYHSVFCFQQVKDDIDRFKAQGVELEAQRQQILKQLEEKQVNASRQADDFDEKLKEVKKIQDQLKAGNCSISCLPATDPLESFEKTVLISTCHILTLKSLSHLTFCNLLTHQSFTV